MFQAWLTLLRSAFAEVGVDDSPLALRTIGGGHVRQFHEYDDLAENHALYNIHAEAPPQWNMPPRYNIAPTQSVYLAHKDKAVELEQLLF